MADGLLERRRGSGTYVRVTDQPPLPPGREGSALVHRLVEPGSASSRIVDLSISVVSSAGGLPDVSLSTADLLDVLPDTGYAPQGLPSLRAAVADHIAGWGLPTTPEQVVVTTGAQQAISAAAACWVRPGDTVVVDDPTYPGALATFSQAGARLVGARVDGDGVRPEDVAQLLTHRPSLVYLQSAVHSPTGTVLSARRRSELAELLATARVPLVEDVTLADLSWDEPLPPIAAHDPDAPIAVVGSFSKLFWGRLRARSRTARPALRPDQGDARPRHVSGWAGGHRAHAAVGPGRRAARPPHHRAAPPPRRAGRRAATPATSLGVAATAGRALAMGRRR